MSCEDDEDIVEALRAIEQESNHQKISGMPEYPSSGKGCRPGAVLLIIFLILGFISAVVIHAKDPDFFRQLLDHFK